MRHFVLKDKNWKCEKQGLNFTVCEGEFIDQITKEEKKAVVTLSGDIITIETPRQRNDLEVNWTGIKSEICVRV